MTDIVTMRGAECRSAGLRGLFGKIDPRRIAMLGCVAIAMSVVADPAFAQASGGQTDISQFLNKIVTILTGPAGQALSVLGICIVGISAMLGSLSVRLAGSVIFGIVLLFSAGWVVTQITQ